MLARGPATAQHIAYQLAQYFVADAPPAALVGRLAARFRETDGDIKAVLKTLFASAEFRDSAGQKYKTPYQFVLSAVRAAVGVENPRPLLGAMGRLGIPVYGCQTPDGYKNTEHAWLSPDATTLRIGFATALGRGALPRTRPLPDKQSTRLVAAYPAAPAEPAAPKAAPIDAGPLERLLLPQLSKKTLSAIAEEPAELRAPMVLGGPAFMRR